MKAIQVHAKGEPMKLVEIPVPQPKAGQVLIQVEACGICHGDSKVIEGWASEYPRIPGHEVVGVITQLGIGVTKWKVGQRVGIGWHGGHNHTTALTMDGGYAEYMVAYEDGLILIPNELSSEEAAPKLCLVLYEIVKLVRAILLPFPVLVAWDILQYNMQKKPDFRLWQYLVEKKKRNYHAN